MRKTNSKGFTIIELLVVIVIIGILVALALPQLFAAQARGRDTERKNDLKNIKTQLETYFNDEGSYPTGTLEAERETLNLSEADIEAPRDNNPPYEYIPSTDGSTYVLRTELENTDDSSITSEGDNAGYYVVESVNQDTGTEQTPTP